ncbi:hypothetical protein I5M27_16930 [Adhaeribacter sp. BT258]|uniref:Uncharacterized protein n=1 Tax=Adhaeribacter terrigena TaxID=2793070 RepID=A0ABS1C5L3_9BACT|nr:hypothetical protein [Adhaeribacter terrigena]MBK0404681.1 hypothetical protein [Adhaeribacter terrigena]
MKRYKKFAILLAAFFLMLLAAEEILLLAQGIRNQRARMDVRGTSRRTARRVNRRHDYWNGSRGTYGGYYAAPVAAAAVVGATAAAVYSLPSGCTDYNGYYNCGGTYYQPQMQGNEVVYIQVEIDD